MKAICFFPIIAQLIAIVIYLCDELDSALGMCLACFDKTANRSCKYIEIRY